MRPSIERRLDRLDGRWRRIEPARAEPAFDFSLLTMEERHELDTLLARIEARPPRPYGRPDYGDLSDEELERVGFLSEKSQATT